MMKHFSTFILLCVWLVGCSEAPLITGELEEELNNPTAMEFIEGTNLALVINANVNLAQPNGSLVAVDLDAQTVLYDTMLSIPSFAGRMWVDESSTRLYVTSRGDDAVLVYDYTIPGENGAAISFSEVSVPDPHDGIVNGVEADEDPFGIYLADNTTEGKSLYVSNNLAGSISLIPVNDLLPLNLDLEHDEYHGFPLISSINFRSEDSRPGRGAADFIPSADGRLLFVMSTVTNDIYVIDTYDHAVEGMLDLSTVAYSGGIRDMAIDSNGFAYLSHRGVDGVVVLDVSGVQDNGIDYDILETVWVDTIPTQKTPESVLLSSDETKLYVSSLTENTVSVIDTASRGVLDVIEVSGESPGFLVADPDPGRNVIYCLNFLSKNISVISEATSQEVGTIE